MPIKTAKKPVRAAGAKAHLRLRRCILKHIYEQFTELPYGQADIGQLADVCRADAKAMNWNLVYLEKCGLIELAKAFDSPPFVACTVSITAAGIDLVEDQATFNKRFPSR